MLEVGKKYTTRKNGSYECINIIGNAAYLISGAGATAYVWDASTGKSKSLVEGYDIVQTAIDMMYNALITGEGVAEAIKAYEATV